MCAKPYSDAWTVELAVEFEPELDGLEQPVQDELLAQARLLERFGPHLGRPRAAVRRTSKTYREAENVTMARTLKQKLRSVPAARRAKIERRASELLEEELSLRELRRALDQTQVEVARKMGVGQDAISRYEQKTDMMLSTLQRYVNAMGGTLALVAEFPDRKPIRVRTLSEIGARRRRRPGSTVRPNHGV